MGTSPTSRRGVVIYFSSWILLSVTCVILNCLNIDWTETDIANGCFIVIIQAILQSFVLEIPMQTVVTLISTRKRKELTRAPYDKLTLILNYNLLATGRDDILECFENMYTGYIRNLSPNVSAVLVSATRDDELVQFEVETRNAYRTIIYDELYREGLAFAKGEYNLIDPLHLRNVWQIYEDIDIDEFVHDHLKNICDKYSKDFMVIHRASRVLKKCGQYQDLMLLSDGEYEAFTYCDPDFYSKCAREPGKPLFHASEDVSNILGRKFDYTLVLDADTGVPRGGVFDMLHIAAAYPERGIIQPAIKLHCNEDDTLFMHLESVRQSINEPVTNAIMALFNQSGYFGKALIKNRLYIDSVIGSKEHLIERVPVDVLSHDTYEAALLHPLYAGSTYLLEAPSYNYVTWHIREMRWNRGEILLAMYFWKTAFGNPIRWIQEKLQKSKFNKTVLRTETKLDFITSYIAHGALRQMLMKPVLFLYVILQIQVNMLNSYISIVIVMFFILIFPKFATCNRKNYRYVLLETFASIVQFTPEVVVGCVRLCRAFYANLTFNSNWVPQRAVEEQFKSSNPFLSSLKHLLGYSIFALVVSVLAIVFVEGVVLILIMLVTIFLLPLFTGITSLNQRFQCCKPKTLSLSDVYRRNIARPSSVIDPNEINTISKGDLYKSVGHLERDSLKSNSSCRRLLEGSNELIIDINQFSNTSKSIIRPHTKTRNSYLVNLWPSKVAIKNQKRMGGATYSRYVFDNEGWENDELDIV